MNEGSRKTALVIGAVAAAAGLAIASYLYVSRLRAAQGEDPRLRDVTEVLKDCYARMEDLQSHLSELTPPRPKRRPAQA